MDFLRSIRDWLYGQWIAREVRRFHGRGGKVVVVTGSYGKTSVKELAYDLTRHKYRAVETSGNYNTPVGIAKTLRYEVAPTTELLILEVGAYHVGEIAWFCRILHPDVGVMTGIARQHLTRFGSWENIIRAKTEIAEYIHGHGGTLIANGCDETVRAHVHETIWYTGGSRGEVNQNGARAIARACGMSEQEIAAAEQHIRSVPNRFEMTEARYGMKVIDDSYNSNEKSFVEAVQYLGRQKKYTRILVTPGLLELGRETTPVHQKLGKLVNGNADVLILVGDTEQTRALTAGASGVRTITIAKTLDFMGAVAALKLRKEPLVLLENDIPETHA